MWKKLSLLSGWFAPISADIIGLAAYIVMVAALVSGAPLHGL